MYIDTSSVTRNNKTYTRHLLRTSYREKGKVKHRTLANLSHCSPEEIEGIRVGLKFKDNLTQLGSVKDIDVKQGQSVGAIWLLDQLAERLGIKSALGHTREGKLALWQVIARIIDQGSRLSSTRLADMHAIGQVLGLQSFNEDDLYHNLDWLEEHQEVIEDRFYKAISTEEKVSIYFYDVTSSYLEGSQNELGAFGYNRDKKKGKKQIVVGLLCNSEGTPLSIEVFPGNTQDPKTFSSQIKKVLRRFNATEVVFVGDRGMIKSAQIEELNDAEFNYITAITKPQVESLIRKGCIEMSLFDKDLAEVKVDGVRYILRKNPIRASEIEANRDDRLRTLSAAVNQQNDYLCQHPKAKVDVALNNIRERCHKLRLTGWISVGTSERSIVLLKDDESLREESKLDGCYVLKTDVGENTTKETLHARYKDLSKVEWVFRTCKTIHLELRPVYVRLASRTKGHAFVVMLAYKIVKELSELWRELNVTVEEGISQLTTLCTNTVKLPQGLSFSSIPSPHKSIKKLLDKAGVVLPDALSNPEACVATKKRLVRGV